MLPLAFGTCEEIDCIPLEALTNNTDITYRYIAAKRFFVKRVDNNVKKAHYVERYEQVVMIISASYEIAISMKLLLLSALRTKVNE